MNKVQDITEGATPPSQPHKTYTKAQTQTKNRMLDNINYTENNETRNAVKNVVVVGGVQEGGIAPFTKSKRELLQELLQMEDDDLGDLGTTHQNLQVKQSISSKIPVTINAVNDSDDDAPITKPKRQLTEKQLDALKKGQQKRNENREQKKALQKQIEDEERKRIEEKLVKKAISIKKKQIKKQAVLDEISDDETPIEKIKQIAAIPLKAPLAPPSLPKIPVFKFF
jgi:hypothetical protein